MPKNKIKKYSCQGLKILFSPEIGGWPLEKKIKNKDFGGRYE